jgi:hypothetical protein
VRKPSRCPFPRSQRTVNDGPGGDWAAVHPNEPRARHLPRHRAHQLPGRYRTIIYTGPFDASTVNNTRIAGATPDFVGNLIVTGGASSGEHFNIRVGAVDVFESIGGISCDPVGPLTVANSLSNTCAQAPGDSGGPVYSYLNSTVLVRGTITGGNSGIACPGTVPIGGFQVIYAPLVRPVGGTRIGSLSFYGAVVLGVPIFDLNGTWTDGPGRGPGPVITVQDRAITVDMSGSAGPARTERSSTKRTSR